MNGAERAKAWLENIGSIEVGPCRPCPVILYSIHRPWTHVQRESRILDARVQSGDVCLSLGLFHRHELLSFQQLPFPQHESSSTKIIQPVIDERLVTYLSDSLLPPQTAAQSTSSPLDMATGTPSDMATANNSKTLILPADVKATKLVSLTFQIETTMLRLLTHRQSKLVTTHDYALTDEVEIEHNKAAMTCLAATWLAFGKAGAYEHAEAVMHLGEEVFGAEELDHAIDCSAREHAQ